MKKDIGFWDKKGNYIEDIQKVDEIEMTEEIIIDGVDVAGCCCYENGKCLWIKRYSENNIVPDCEKVKDCYYKQLKRLEQENAELKAENERLMKQFDIEKLTNKETGLSIYRSNKELMFREFEQNVSKKLIKYLNTLQEIKAIAENRTYYIDFTRSKSYLELEQDYAKITNDLENRLFKILQKISEVG